MLKQPLAELYYTITLIKEATPNGDSTTITVAVDNSFSGRIADWAALKTNKGAGTGLKAVSEFS